MKHGNLLNHFFRAANVLRHSTNWVGLIQNVTRKIAAGIVIVHEDDVDQARHTRMAETILRLTLCQGRNLEDSPKPVQQLFHKILLVRGVIGRGPVTFSERPSIFVISDIIEVPGQDAERPRGLFYPLRDAPPDGMPLLQET